MAQKSIGLRGIVPPVPTRDVAEMAHNNMQGQEQWRTFVQRACQRLLPMRPNPRLEEYAPMLVRDYSRGWTVLHLACYVRSVESLRLIQHIAQLPGVDLNARSLVGDTPLEVACKRGFRQAALLLHKYGAHTRDCLHEACASGDADLVRYLVKQWKIPINRPYGIDRILDDPIAHHAQLTPLVWATMAYAPVHIVQALLELGADPTGLLESACYWGHAQLVPWLLDPKRSFSHNGDGSWGESPLEILCVPQGNPFDHHLPLSLRIQCFEHLLASGVESRERGGSPLVACDRCVSSMAALYFVYGKEVEAMELLQIADGASPTQKGMMRLWTIFRWIQEMIPILPEIAAAAPRFVQRHLSKYIHLAPPDLRVAAKEAAAQLNPAPLASPATRDL